MLVTKTIDTVKLPSASLYVVTEKDGSVTYKIDANFWLCSKDEVVQPSTEYDCFSNLDAKTQQKLKDVLVALVAYKKLKEGI